MPPALKAAARLLVESPRTPLQCQHFGAPCRTPVYKHAFTQMEISKHMNTETETSQNDLATAHSPRPLSFKANLILTLEVLAVVLLIGGALWLSSHWITK
jgi:hypothetical protein